MVWTVSAKTRVKALILLLGSVVETYPGQNGYNELRVRLKLLLRRAICPSGHITSNAVL